MDANGAVSSGEKWSYLEDDCKTSDKKSEESRKKAAFYEF